MYSKKRKRFRTLDEAKKSGLKRAIVCPGIQYDKDTEHFIAEVYIGLDSSGRAKRIHKTFSTEKEAKKWKTKTETEFQSGEIPENFNSKITVGEWIDKYIDDISHRIEKTTLDGYKRVSRRIQKHPLSGIKLSSLNRSHIEYYLRANVDEKVLNNKTINKDLDLIKSALNYAAECGIISYNPIQSVKRLPTENIDIQTYDQSEINRLLECVKADKRLWFRAFVYLSATTGMRRGEVFGLRWQDVDLWNNTIMIQNTRVPVNGKIIDKSPKTKASRRKIELIPKCNELLMALEEYQKEKGIYGEYVFVNDHGKPFDPKSGDRMFKRLLKDNNLRDIRLHDLRHTVATLIQESGGTPIDVSAYLGHSRVSTTTNIYSHISEEGARRATNKMKEIIKA